MGNILKKEQELEELSTEATKIGSLFQIMFYNIDNGYQRTPLHIMNAAEIYEKCKSRELITCFDKSGLCVGYNVMKKHHSDLAKDAGQGKERNVALPSHFSPSSFTAAVFDKFEHLDKSSGNASAHDTAVNVFQKNLTNLCGNR